VGCELRVWLRQIVRKGDFPTTPFPGGRWSSEHAGSWGLGLWMESRIQRSHDPIWSPAPGSLNWDLCPALVSSQHCVHAFRAPTDRMEPGRLFYPPLALGCHAWS